MGGKGKRKGKGKKKINKDRDAEGWCFVCKDGGDLRICDYRQCLKSYHPECVGEDDSFLESNEKWDCAWHRCFHCGKYSYGHCCMCTKAVCFSHICLTSVEILPVRGAYGFCKSCLELALLFEEKKDCESDEGMVENNLLQLYYAFIKKREGFELEEIYAAKERFPVSGSEDYDEEEEEEHVSESEKFENEKTKWQNKRKRSRGQKPTRRTPVSSNDKEFTGSTSKHFASFVVKNVKLVYLKRSVLKEMLKEPEVFEEKVTGCFVRVKSDPYDPQYQLMQVKGAKTVSTDENKTETVLLLSNMPTAEIHISLISDEDFSEEEFEDLRKKVEAGEIQRPTVEDLQQKAKSLHRDMTIATIRMELGLLKKDFQDDLYWYMNRKKTLQSQTELERMLKNIPTVIPDACDFGIRASDEDTQSTPLSENAPAVIPLAFEPEADINCGSGEGDEGCPEQNANTADSNAKNDGKSDEDIPESTTISDSLPSDELHEKEKKPEEHSQNVPVFEKPKSREPQQGREIEVIEISDGEDESEEIPAAVRGNPEEEMWCVRCSDSEINKFQLGFLRNWCGSSAYVPNFAVWREDGREEDAITLREAAVLWKSVKVEM